MAQLMVSWFVYDGVIRLHAINAVLAAKAGSSKSKSSI